ncbi:MAG TPA: cytidylate kinase-like family protein [Chloroflexota bacterium]|nr:cytidylate kinase-like family protein [Chloroflexota bacterium]
MPVVTVSRQFASGGGEVAQEVARRLGATLVDREIIDEVARRLGVPDEVVLEKDERAESLVARLARSLRLSYPDLAMPPDMTSAVFTDYGGFDDLPYAEVTQQVIREVARSGNAVIVGRGGAFVLKDEPNTLHVHIQAPFARRVQNTMRLEGLDQAAAERLVQEMDRERARYIKTLFKADWEAMRHYHLVIDCERLGQTATVELIVYAATHLSPGA